MVSNKKKRPPKNIRTQHLTKTLEKLEHDNNIEPILILPVAIKYVYRQDIRGKLDSALSRLEQQLAIKLPRKQSFIDRVRAVANAVLIALQEEYNFKAQPDASLNEQLAGLRATILRQVAANLHVDLSPGATHLEWAHKLQKIVYEMRYGEKNDGDTLKQIAHDHAEELRRLSKDLHRVVNFIAIYENNLRNPATQEQCAELIDLLEQEVFGSRSSKGPRSVLIDIGEPIKSYSQKLWTD